MELEFIAIFFFFFLSLIGHNSILNQASFSLKLNFEIIEFQNMGILPNILKNMGRRLESPSFGSTRGQLYLWNTYQEFPFPRHS